MKFQHPHLLSRDEARQRLTLLLDHWHQRQGVSVTWNGDTARATGKVKGFDFDASLTVLDHCVDAEGTDPGFLLRAAATAYLKQKLSSILDPDKTTEESVRDA